MSRTNDPGVRRICQVADDSGYELQLTLFGDHTKLDEEIDGPLNSADKPILLAMQNIQIRQFRGGLNGSTLRTSHVVVNPGVLEATHLRDWLQADEGRTCTWKSLSEGTGATGDFASGGRGDDSNSSGGIKVHAAVAALLLRVLPDTGGSFSCIAVASIVNIQSRPCRTVYDCRRTDPASVCEPVRRTCLKLPRETSCCSCGNHGLSVRSLRN